MWFEVKYEGLDILKNVPLIFPWLFTYGNASIAVPMCIRENSLSYEVKLAQNFSTKFWHYDQRFSRNIFHPMCKVSKLSCVCTTLNYLLIYTIYRFSDITSIGSSLMNKVYRWCYERNHMDFTKEYSHVKKFVNIMQ